MSQAGRSEPEARAGRSEATRLRLIRAAERLFADHGFKAVSLRQIGAAADQRNTSAVRYHFGDKDGLIEAIFERRQAELEGYRRVLLAAIPPEGPQPDGAATIDALLGVIVRAPLMIADAEARYDYVRLIAAYLNRDRDSGLRHPLDYAPTLLPALVAVHERLFRACRLPRDIFDLRIQMIVGLALQAVIQRRIRLSAGLPCPDEDVVIEEMMAMAGGAMRAPLARGQTHATFLN